MTTVEPETQPILGAVRAQVAHGRYGASTLCGDGQVSARIAEALARLTPYGQKRLHCVAGGGA